MANTSGTFTAVGSSSAVAVTGNFNISIQGQTQGQESTIWLERSFDAGTTWKPIEAFDNNVEKLGTEAEASCVTYRLRCSNHTVGTITYRLGN